MTFFASDPVSSGLAYVVISVGGSEPERLDQFVGDATFAVSRGSAESVIAGRGSAVGDGVRFQEKDLRHAGKDVRVWQISPDPGGGFTAVTVSSF
jgi:hypothetical protein